MSEPLPQVSEREAPKHLSRRDRLARTHVLHAGLVACYEIIDRIRKELAALEVAK